LCGVLQLIVGVDGRRLRRAVEISFRRINVEVADGGADVVDVEIFCARRVSLKSSSWVSDTLFDVTASVRIGASAGLILA
jgi:hypothetical protein